MPSGSKRNSESAVSDNVQAADAAKQAAIAAEVRVMEIEAEAEAALAGAAIPTPVQAALADVEAAEAALAVATRPAIRIVLEAALADARGMLALAEAEAVRQLERAEAEAEATLAVQGMRPAMREAALAAALAAIELEYAPVQESPVEAETAPVPQPTVRRKEVSARNAAINSAVQADSASASRGAAMYSVWEKSGDFTDFIAPGRTSGTRYPTFIPLCSAGAGVLNYADLKVKVAEVRHFMRTVKNIGGVGNGTGTYAWLARRGNHSPTGGKDDEYAALCFASGATVALYPDGRFRLASADDAALRYIDVDDAAYSQFIGGTVTETESAPAAPQTPRQNRIVPTAPSVQADSATGKLAQTAFCHCGRRNVVGEAACLECGAEDWNSAA